MPKKVANKVVVLGAGVGGVGAALEIARNGFEVVILEEKKDILSGTSSATPGRAGHGFHYVNSSTGKLYLDATIDVMREYPGCTLGHGRPEDDFMRHGLYMVMKEKGQLPQERQMFSSLYPPLDILGTYEELREHYRQLVLKDSGNEIFGSPDHFFLEKDKGEFSGIVDIENIETVVDTREELLDWPKLKQELKKRVSSSPGITVVRCARVGSMQYGRESGYIVKTDKGEFKADFVVNSTWHDMDRIADSMGLYSTVEDRTMRLKGLVRVTLPDLLRDKSSMFFCIGPHCMFSNMGNGTGMMTYAPVTNISQGNGMTISEYENRLLSGGATEHEKAEFAEKVVEGVSRYIPEMTECSILDVNFGIIKTKGGVNVFSADSDFHRRDYLGVEEAAVGVINNASMKLLYFTENARAVASILVQQDKAKKIIDTFLLGVSTGMGGDMSKDIMRFFAIMIERGFSSAEIIDQPSAVFAVIQAQNQRRGELMAELLGRRRAGSWRRIIAISSLVLLGVGAFMAKKFAPARLSGLSIMKGSAQSHQESLLGCSGPV